MKILSCLFVLTGLLLVSGCSTPRSVTALQGRGTKHTFDVSYDVVLNAVKSVTLMSNLNILKEDEARGFISASRGMADLTFGDNVAIWIRQVSPIRTEVEIIGRRIGPPVPFASNLERTILKNVTLVLSSRDKA